MTIENETAVARREVGVGEAQPLAISPQYIESTVRSLGLLQQMVRDVLVRGRDYGRVLGIPSDFLWDPGASQIIASFNCHVGHRRFLSFVDDGQKIAVVVEVPIVHNASGLEVGSGIGASSTKETKHKYRWIDNPREWGFDDEAIKSMRTKTQDGRTLYRMLNPEHDELLNTIVRMGSKRAEVDGAEGLPGASSALRELFSGKAPSKGKAGGPAGEGEDGGPKWTTFWSQANVLLGDEAQRQGIDATTLVHQMLGVTSMKDWLSKGKSLDQAIKALSDKMAGGKPVSWDKVTKDQVPDYDHLESVLLDLAGLKPAQIYRELGGGSRADMTMPAWEAYLALKEAHAPAPPDG